MPGVREANLLGDQCPFDPFQAGLDIEIAALLDDPPLWSTKLAGFGADDLLAVAWPAAGVIAVLGDADVVLLDTSRGECRVRAQMRWTHQSPLEWAALDLSADGSLLVVTSTRLVRVFDARCALVAVHEPSSILLEPLRMRADGFEVVEFDENAPDETAVRFVPFP